MIIGDGLIGKAFANSAWAESDSIVFASGVSNSKEHDAGQFMREESLLVETLKLKMPLIYFSTCSVYDSAVANTKYVLHKLKMENIVKEAVEYSIIRLPQAVGFSKNPNTLTNYIFEKITSNKEFEIWRYAYRNLIDVEDVVLLVNHMLDVEGLSNRVDNIANTNEVSMLELIRCFSDLLGEKPSYKLVEKGSRYSINTEKSALLAKQINLNFNDRYTAKLLEKYYGKIR